MCLKSIILIFLFFIRLGFCFHFVFFQYFFALWGGLI